MDKNILIPLKQLVSPLMPGIIKKDDQLALALLKYIIDGSNIEKYQFDEFVSKAVMPISLNIGETAMSLAEKLKQEGLELGFQKGSQAVAKRMLEMGADDAFILKATGLTKEELAAIKKG